VNRDDPRIVAGLATQARKRRAAQAGGAARLGWKAGLGTAAAMQRVAIDAPLVGYITGQTLLADGTEVAIAGWSNPTLEAEVAIRLGADVPAGATRSHTLAAVAAVGPAIELVDLGPPDDVEAVLAGNIFHRAVLLGELAPWPSGRDLDGVRLEIHTAGAPSVHDVDPRELLGDLVEVVRALADQLPAADDVMRAGDVVITGAAAPASALQGGEQVTVAVAGSPGVTVRVR
jgi:2-keto-4-pentenoate hydratase